MHQPYDPPLAGKLIMFENRLAKVYRHLSRIALRQGISCYRVFDRDLPEFPLIIECYGGNIYVAEYKSSHRLSAEAYAEWLEGSLAVIGKVMQAGEENIFCKSRQRKAGRGGQYQKFDTAQQEYVVTEGNLKFLVNLSDYLDTGLFLDHRVTRGMVREESAGKKFLNLFCYTGSFTVYAAAGGAAETVSIDLSNTYINWAKRNMAINGMEGPEHRFIKADVLQALPDLPGKYFDLVVLDPPTFSNSKMMRDILDIQRDHVQLINQCLRTMKKGGRLYFSTNLRGFRMDEKSILAASVKDITKATTPFDFEKKLLRWCYLITA